MTQEVLAEALVQHYVTAIDCDHEAKTDTVRCNCSVWTGTPQPSVGAAVREWADHVAALVRTPETLDVEGVPVRRRSPTPPEGLTDEQWNEAYRAGRAAGITEVIDSGAASPAPDPGAGPDTLRRAVVAAASIFLAAHDRVVDSTPVTRDDTFAMKNAADNLRDVLREYALDPLPQWPDGPVPTAVQNAWNEAHLAAEDAAPSAEPPETPDD